MASGGQRRGAGRPKGARNKRGSATTSPAPAPTSPAPYADAEAYLSAVVEGREIPDPLRLVAAKALIVFQRARQRVPIPSLPPSQLARRDALGAEDALAEEFARRAELIRARHRSKQ